MRDGAVSPSIRLTDLAKSFGSVRAVDGVSLEIADGEFFSMLGPSGSGKTTVLRMIAGFEQPTAGSIELAGQSVTDLPPFARDVNTVFQDYALFPHMSVAQNVEYGLRVKKVKKAERRARAAEALETVRLSHLADRRPTQLSGGQRQRVALARALVNRPKVLLLDEPLGALDLKLRREMQIELKQIQRDVGITFVFVTHDQEEALTLSDRIAVFNDGRIEQVATPRELYQNPKSSFVAAFVGTSNMLTGPAARAVFGREGTLSIRPEKIHLGDVPDPGASTVTGTVREVVYLGSANHYVVDVDMPWAGDAPQLVVMRQNFHDSDDQLSRRGEKVRLAWLPEHVIELPGSSESTPIEETA
ncbi:ABC transporter ATP-binding protein [Nocardioides marmorisolisilvae]|uniref:ABC transporter ATP-binding protein n=1 Tax=Nocardioides marmorisolisilvae TaxID=1542737 RepID=A0A3N0DS49_9ACTN|nr:ABC transporter ATP-binding protein [Nocardioides marmorisolisilvae]RNL78457.1 ABC transporter ATP-binding protein [Nocardioides marmorisolisilvae]